MTVLGIFIVSVNDNVNQCATYKEAYIKQEEKPASCQLDSETCFWQLDTNSAMEAYDIVFLAIEG